MNRWQPRRVLFPLCQLGGRLTCHRLEHQSLPPVHRRIPNTTKILPGCPLISILKSMGGRSVTTPLINKPREGPHCILIKLQEYCSLHCSSSLLFRQVPSLITLGCNPVLLIYPYVQELEHILLH